MIVDVHAHYIPKNFSDLMGDRFLPRVGVPVKTGIARHPVSDAPEDISGGAELMDAAGVEKQVLSPHWAALFAGRGGVRQSGAHAQRRLCRVGAPLS
jgi:hypothetical protein